ncbi:MAG: hypothetical protein R6U78_11535 [Bacteroidales bacterium]
MMMKVSYGIAIVLLCLCASIPGQEVEISMDHPQEVTAGSEFRVTVNIQKGSLTDYSRFSQDLPMGLTATNISSPNADFSFDNHRIRIIWLRMPEEDEVEVSYNVLVDERLKGSFALGGVFAYVVEDERKFLNIEPSGEITILPSPSVDPSRVVDIRDFQRGIQPQPEAADQETRIMVVRQKPVLLSSGGYLVRLLVKNPEGSKYAKIEETIPSGYIFEQANSHDAIVSFAASTVKFIWMKLPPEPEFEVTYRLVPKQGEPQGEMEVAGSFTYTVGDANRVVEIQQVDEDLEALTLAEKRNLLQAGELPGGTRPSTEGEVPARDTEPSAGTTEPSSGTTGQPSRVTEPPARRAEQTAGTSRRIVGTRVLTPESGLYYRVQLIATETPFDASEQFTREGIDREVYVELHEGLYKYTAGSFETYSQASAYRDRVERLPSADGPFVVTYRDGTRVPTPVSGYE